MNRLITIQDDVFVAADITAMRLFETEITVILKTYPETFEYEFDDEESAIAAFAKAVLVLENVK